MPTRFNYKNQIEAAATTMRKSFPFEDTLQSMRKHRAIAETVMRQLSSGHLLDFGSGACDKSALLALCGYRVSACDDLSDHWHLQDGNRDKIIKFAKQMGIEFFLIKHGDRFPYQACEFDVVLLADVIEHLHDSPYELLCKCMEWLKPHGLLLITVPNAVNLRKRAYVLAGRSNYPSYDQLFWYPPPWRGHVREYVVDDLQALARFMHLEVLELRGIHAMVDKAIGNTWMRSLYLALMSLIPIPGIADTLILLGRKPEGWTRKLVERYCPGGPRAKPT